MISKKVNGEKAVLFFESEFTIHEVKEVREITKEEFEMVWRKIN